MKPRFRYTRILVVALMIPGAAVHAAPTNKAVKIDMWDTTRTPDSYTPIVITAENNKVLGYTTADGWHMMTGAGGSSAWGDITGTLASQTDLQTALTARALTGAVGSSGLTVATGKLLGRTTASTGTIESITPGTGLTFSAGGISVDWANTTLTGTTKIAALTTIPANSGFITVGDSRTAIGGSGLSAGEEWPAQLAAMSGFAGRVTLTNPAAGGDVVANWVSRYATDVFPLRPSVTGKYTILSIFAPGNDIASGTSASATDTALAAYVATARADGFSEVWLLTDIHRASFTAAQYAQWLELNRLCRWRLGTTYDKVIDLATAFPNINDTSFSGDALHPNASGMKAIARYINQEVQLAAPAAEQDSAVNTKAFRSLTAVIDTELKLATEGSAAPLNIGGSGVFGNIVMQATTAQANDLSGLSFFARSSGADAGARNFIVYSNASAGKFAILQSTDNTTGALNSRLEILQDGTVNIPGTLTAGGLAATSLTGTIAAARMPAMTGDATSSAGAVALTLATVNGNVGSFGSTTSIPSFTVNAKGLITAASANTPALPGTAIASGTVDPARLGSGSSITTKFLRGDSTWQTLGAGSGDMLAANNLSDVANKDTARGNLGIQRPVAAVATSSLTLSGEQTIDGVSTSASIVLATAQGDAATNGFYITSSSGWARPAWFANAGVYTDNIATVTGGTVYAGSVWFAGIGAITVGTTGQTWTQQPVNAAWLSGTVANARLDADLQTFAGITPGSGVGTWLATPSHTNFAAAITGETGTGAPVFGTSPTIATPIFTGIKAMGAGAYTVTASAMGALAIDVAAINNTKSISTDSTVTFSGAPASTTTFFGATVKNTDSASHTLTLPSCFSMVRQTTAAHVITIPAGGRADLQFKYDGTDYTVFGDDLAINDLTTATPDTGADYYQFYDATDGLHKKALLSTIAGTAPVNEAYGSGWNADTGAPEKDDVYDWGHVFDTDDDGLVDKLDIISAAGFGAFTSGGVPVQGRTLTGTANQIGVTNGTGASADPVFSLVSSAVLPGSPTVATPGTGAGSVATIDGTQTLTGKTVDGASNVLKMKNYIYLTHPHLADGTNATIGTTATAIGYGHATFSNSVDKASNYVEYYFMVPEDIDTSVALRARLKIALGNTDTGKQGFRISSVSVADSAVPTASTLANEISINFAGDASGANGDVETSSWTTLTSWAGALTAGQTWRIRLARDGDDGTDDTSTVNCTELGLVLEYGLTQ